MIRWVAEVLWQSRRCRSIKNALCRRKGFTRIASRYDGFAGNLSGFGLSNRRYRSADLTGLNPKFNSVL
jgi:hypothetical protein